jgi:hypothetical protein
MKVRDVGEWQGRLPLDSADFTEWESTRTIRGKKIPEKRRVIVALRKSPPPCEKPSSSADAGN